MRIKFLKSYKSVYNFLKKTIKSILPKAFLYRNEIFFRSIYGVFYSGNNHQCNVCQQKLRSFIQKPNKDLICPYCGSLSRTRRLWNQLHVNNDLKGKILHFSPSRSLYRKLKHLDGIHYYSSDYENEFLAEHRYDITQIPVADETFDTIICYHILEHIEKDALALSELYRVLKPQGVVYIQTPFKIGEIYEDFSITSPEARTEHFGQDDHVRIYSVSSLMERLHNTGFKVNILQFEDSIDDAYKGFRSPETILLATKV